MRSLFSLSVALAFACGSSGGTSAPVSGGGGSSAGGGGSGGSSAGGSCTSGADQAARISHDMRLELAKCYVACVGEPETCIRDCLVKSVGLSPGCGTCYGDLAWCGRLCACPDLDASTCAECHAKCETAFSSCSGVEPPPKS